MHLTGISLIEFVMIPREEASLWDEDEWKRYSSWERQRNQQGLGRLPPLVRQWSGKDGRNYRKLQGLDVDLGRSKRDSFSTGQCGQEKASVLEE